MPCTQPITGYRSKDGAVRFDSQAARGAVALFAIQVPCGRCMGCRVIRASEWTTRIMHELQMHSEAGKLSAFITLTYDDEHLPSDWGLHVEEWQLFAKRLRKHYGQFRYYMCGEYGEKNQRPHFHAIIFGVDFNQDAIPLTANTNGHALYLSPTLTRIWGRGQTRFGRVEPASAAYVAAYSLKRRSEHDPIYKRVNGQKEWWVRPEFATMSLKPAIGKTWLQKYESDIYPSDETIIHGRRVRTPRYYDTLLETKDANLLTEVKTQRLRRALKHKADTTKQRLDDYEQFLTIQHNNKSKTL